MNKSLFRARIVSFRSAATLLALLLAFQGFVASQSFAGGSFVQQVKLSASDGDDEDYLGSAVATSGSYLAAGVPYDWDGLVVGTGAVYVFESNKYVWSEVQKLTPVDGDGDDEFGLSLAMQGDLMVVGAPGHSQRQGAVYLFERQGRVWTPRQKLSASDGASGHAFGASVSLNGEQLLIGAPSALSSRGAVYLFRQIGGAWVQQQKIVASDGASGDAFGVSVVLSGERLAVGARLDDILSNGDNRGSVYVYENNGSSFVLSEKLFLADARVSDEFGASVAFAGSELLVGAPFRDLGVTDDNSGLIFRYRKEASGWTLAGSLADPDLTPRAGFGLALAGRGTTLIAGAPFATNTTGFAVHFELGESWQVQEKFAAQDARPFEYFGKSVALGEEFAAIGAEFADVGPGLERGAVYTYVRGRTTTSIEALVPSPAGIGETVAVDVRVDSPFAPPSADVIVQSSDGQQCIASLSAGEGNCVLSGHAIGIKSVTAAYPGSQGLGESSAAATLRIVPYLDFTTALLPKGKIARAYQQQLEVDVGGATPPLSFGLASGALPSGLFLGHDGQISGTAEQAGRFVFEVRVLDSSDESLGGPFSAFRTFALDIDPAFSTTLSLQTESSVSFRGQSVIFLSDLQVLESEAGPPAGTYSVRAQRGAVSLECSSAVVQEGGQACSILFGTTQPEGQYAIVASFVSDVADYGPSESNATHVLNREVDLAVALQSSPSFYKPGQQVTYLASAGNLGADAAQGAQFSLMPAAEFTNISWQCIGVACPLTSGTGPIHLALDLRVDEFVQFSLSARAPEAASSELETSARVLVPDGSFQVDVSAANNTALNQMRPLLIHSDGFEK